MQRLRCLVVIGVQVPKLGARARDVGELPRQLLDRQFPEDPHPDHHGRAYARSRRFRGPFALRARGAA